MAMINANDAAMQKMMASDQFRQNILRCISQEIMAVASKGGTSYEFNKEVIPEKDMEFFMAKFKKAEYMITETNKTITLDWSHKMEEATQELTEKKIERSYTPQNNRPIDRDIFNRLITPQYQMGSFNPYAQMFNHPYGQLFNPYYGQQFFTQLNSPDYETRQNALFNNGMNNDLME